MTQENLYEITKAFVENYPQDMPICETLQSFAVLREDSDINTPNLAKAVSERHKNYFFSRAWARTNHNPSNLVYDYPLLVLVQQDIAIDNPFGENTSDCHLHEVRVLDKLDETCDECGNGCKERNEFEVRKDTNLLLKRYIAYLKNIVFDIDLDKYIHKSFATNIDIAKTKQFLKRLRIDNKEMAILSEYGYIDKLTGSNFRLKICHPYCIDENLDYHSPNFKKGADLNCC